MALRFEIRQLRIESLKPSRPIQLLFAPAGLFGVQFGAIVVELVPLDDDESALAPLLADPAPGPEAAATSRQAALQLLHLVEALPAVQREAFLLQEEGGLSLAEIAAATGAGVETIKSRLRYAMTRLREGMRNFT